MIWTTKALIQRVLSKVPAGGSIYYLGQRYVGGFRNFSIDGKVGQGHSLLQSLAEAGEDLEGRTAVEIGTGWTPVVPLLFWLHGQERCYTYDTNLLLRGSLVIEAARQMKALVDRPDIPPLTESGRQRFIERLETLVELAESKVSHAEILRLCNIVYRGRTDAAATGLPEGSIDLVYSNTVLEHVPENEIYRLFHEAYRILKPGGLMVHLIDLSDHFSHSDRSISAINFLQFPERSFSRYNNRFTFQNRLRAPAWRRIIENCGFEIVSWRASVDKRAISALPSLQLDEAFVHLAPEDVCTSSINTIARRR